MQTEDDVLRKETSGNPASPGGQVCELEIQVKNADGLHMRPAMQFVDTASLFDCDISVSNGSNTVDGKSIMQVSMLAATCGTMLAVKAVGPDAAQAVESLRKLVEEARFEDPGSSDGR